MEAVSIDQLVNQRSFWFLIHYKKEAKKMPNLLFSSNALKISTFQLVINNFSMAVA